MNSAHKEHIHGDALRNAEEELEKRSEEFNAAVDQMIGRVEGFVQEGQRRIATTIHGVQETANDVLQAIEKKPMALWVVTFVSGYLMGALMQRGRTEKGEQKTEKYPLAQKSDLAGDHFTE